MWGGGGGVGSRGVWVGVRVNEELKFWGKFTKKKSGEGGGGSGGGQVGRSGWWGGGGGVRVDVNAMLGVGGDLGYVNQEEKVLYNVQKGIVQY